MTKMQRGRTPRNYSLFYIMLSHPLKNVKWMLCFFHTFRYFSKVFLEKGLTFAAGYGIISFVESQICWCGSMAEQLICNQQVDGSTPFTSSMRVRRGRLSHHMGEFPSGQRGQTVNLLSLTSMVRIHLPPPRTT